MIFSDEETFAGLNLILQAMRSPNFVAGSTGWSINKDGSAEFNNITIRGSTTTQGLVLMYNGTPALGNLFLSISPTAGTDAFGNAYVAGEGLYGANGTVTAKDTPGNTAKLTGQIGGGGLLANFPGLVAQLIRNTGDPATVGALDPGGPLPVQMSLLLTSPSAVVGGLPATNFSQINMNGAYAGLPSEIDIDTGILRINSGTTFNATGVIDSYGADAFPPYAPTVTGSGGATWSTRTGWYQRLGKMVYFNAYLSASGAGSGAASFQVDTPTPIYRGTRQTISAHISGVTGPGAGEYSGLCFTSGTGATIDRLTRGGANLTGVDITAAALITIEGWYREA